MVTLVEISDDSDVYQWNVGRSLEVWESNLRKVHASLAKRVAAADPPEPTA